MKQIKFKQCVLNKNKLYTITWIPEQFAIVGKIISLQNSKTKEWDDNWKVDISYEHTLTQKQLEIEQNQIRNTRKTSDI